MATKTKKSKLAKYNKIRSDILPGDIIAFSGKGAASGIIKWATKSNISHVGIVLRKSIFQEDYEGEGPLTHINELMESTMLEGHDGVITSLLSTRINKYDGKIWWLQLNPTFRKKLNLAKYLNWMVRQKGKKYDLPQAIQSALDATDKIPILSALTYAQEDFGKFFCSELATAGLEAGGAIKSINASEVTPADLCRFNIYKRSVQLKGTKETVTKFNTAKYEGFGI